MAEAEVEAVSVTVEAPYTDDGIDSDVNGPHLQEDEMPQRQVVDSMAGTHSRMDQHLDKASEELKCIAELQIEDDQATANLEALVHCTGDLVAKARYNNEILGFLQKWMLEVMEAMAGESYSEIEALLKICEKMMSRHAKQFDLHDFYTVDEAVELVEQHCKNLSDHLLKCGRLSTNMSTNIPPDDVSKDRASLKKCLRLLLSDLHKDIPSWGPSGFASYLEEWQQLRSDLRSKLAGLMIFEDPSMQYEFTTDEAIGRTVHNEVFEAVWKGSPIEEGDCDPPRRLDDTGRTLVAVKGVVSGPIGLPADKLARFYSEVTLQAPVRHPNVARLLAIGTSGIMVMHRADGDLQSWYKRQPPGRNWRLVIDVLYQAASGLCHLHSIDLIHRDIKPQNFLVFERAQAQGASQAPVVQVCDFGITVGQSKDSRLTTARAQPGTERYTGPEFLKNKRHSRKSDVFSFGVVMGELVANMGSTTWASPYGNVEKRRLSGLQMEGRPPFDIGGECPEQLKALVAKCQLCTPEARPEMQQVRDELGELLRSCPPS